MSDNAQPPLKAADAKNPTFGVDSVSVEVGTSYSADEESIVVRKIDMRLLPLMLVAYLLQFMDKIAFGNAAIMGIRTDLKLTGLQYSWASSIFYFGYLIASYPGSIGFTKLPLAKYLSATIVMWSVILMLHAVPHNFAGIMVLRFFLGVFESLVSPGFSLITSVWYKQSEHASRHGVWFIGNSLGSIFGGLISYGIAQITTFTPWKVLFLLYGGVTFVWGLVMIIFLPDSPSQASFLSDRQRQIAASRVASSQLNPSRKYNKDQIHEVFRDPVTYLLFAYSFLTCMANGALTNFGTIVISGFGFSTLNTLLLQVPNSVLTLLLVLAISWVSHRVPQARCILMITFLLISLVGAVMIRQLSPDLRVARLWGMYLFSTVSVNFPLALSLVASNVVGQTKKTVVQALFFVGYCAGNIAGPQVFLQRESPSYTTAFSTMIACVGICTVVILSLRTLWAVENKKRNDQWGNNSEPFVNLSEQGDEDLTDKQLYKSLRYMY